MTHDFANIVATEGAVLADAAAEALAAPVPAAPDWDAAELLRHLGTVYGRVSAVLRTGTMERPTVANGMISAAPADDVVPWFRTRLADLVDVFLPLFAAKSPGDGRTVHLHATDAEGEWMIRFDAVPSPWNATTPSATPPCAGLPPNPNMICLPGDQVLATGSTVARFGESGASLARTRPQQHSERRSVL